MAGDHQVLFTTIGKTSINRKQLSGRYLRDESADVEGIAVYAVEEYDGGAAGEGGEFD